MKAIDPANPLQASVLVLNRSYMAVHVVSVRRAFILLYRDTAEVIHVEDGRYMNYDFESWRAVSELRGLEPARSDDDWVRSVHYPLQAPRVIRLVSFDRAPRQTLRFNRRNLFARDGHQCQYCGHSFPVSQLSVDHVVPRSRGGPTSWENVVCSCTRCNTRKGGRTPSEARMKLIRQPRRPRHNPLIVVKLRNPKYKDWRPFLPSYGERLGHSA